MNTLIKALLAALAAAAVAGCQSDAQTLAKYEPNAVDVAVKRAQFELSCPTANGSVLESKMVQPVLNGPLVHGVERGEYTVGVAGCDKRQTYVVVCPIDNSGCFAAEGERP